MHAPQNHGVVVNQPIIVSAVVSACPRYLNQPTVEWPS